MDGPASVTVQSGAVDVFGVRLDVGCRVVVRVGKRLPFLVAQDAEFEVALGAEGAVSTVEGDTVPASWLQAFERLVGLEKKPITVMVVGSVDSGKTSFCTYLSNKLIASGWRVAVVDEDLGQSDIGPPCTIAYAYLTKPVTDLFNVNPHRTIFIGATSPSGTENQVLDAAETLKTTFTHEAQADCVIVNTDGWTTGEAASAFKYRLAQVFQPTLTFCFDVDAEGTQFCNALASTIEPFRLARVDSPLVVKERGRLHRRSLRELGYVRYFQGGRVRVYNSTHTIIMGINHTTLFSNDSAVNLLVGLYDLRKQFLGIGVVRGIDFVRKAVKVYTTVEPKPAAVFFGKVRLDENLHEIASD